MNEFFTRYLDFIPAFLYKACVYLGIGIISFVGYDLLITEAKDFILNHFEKSPYYEFLEYTGIIDVIYYIISALTIKASALKAKQFGVIKD